jgi:hypothetical protein
VRQYGFSVMSRESSDTAQGPLFVAELASASSVQGTAELFERWPGLRAVACVSNTDRDGCKLVTTWLTKHHCDAAIGAFARELGVEATPSWSGFRLSEVRAREGKTLWEQLKASYLVLVTAVAVLGTLAALSDYYASLWGKPAIQLSGDTTLDVAEHSDVTVAIASSNVGIHSGRISWKLATSSSSNVEVLHDLKQDPVVHPKVAVGSSETIKLPLRTHSAGTYDVKLLGSAESGLFAAAVPLSFAIKLRVWSPLQVNVPLSLLSTKDATRAECLLIVDAGIAYANGLDFTAELAKTPGVRFVAAIGPAKEAQEASDNQATGEEFASLDWQTWPLQATKSYEMKIVLASDVPRSKEQWGKACERISVSSSPRH